LSRALRRDGLAYTAVVVSASHTHSGPGAYAESALFGVIAVDRYSAAVRERILDAMVRVARDAEAHKATADVLGGRAERRGMTERLAAGVRDPERGVIKLPPPGGRPLRMGWNTATHGTALGRANRRLPGDPTADASARLERELGVPALFVNGAEG